VIGKGRQDILTPPGWPLWRMTYHSATSVWKMPPSWHWTGHSRDYWQHAHFQINFPYSLNWCKPNNDNNDELD